MFDRTIIEDALPTLADVDVAHYTRISTLQHFMPDGGLGWSSARATPVQFLNDRMELTLGLEVLRDVADHRPMSGRRVRGRIRSLVSDPGRLETDAFQMSFSANLDELSQWRGYAANGMGCAVVTDARSLHAVGDIAGWVVYHPKKQRSFAYKVLDRLRNLQDDSVIDQQLIAAASFMKHDGFESEMEFRLLKFPNATDVKFRETGDRLVPYTDLLGLTKNLPVKRIVVGPGWQLSALTFAEFYKNYVVEGIDRLLKVRGLASVPIEPSRIPYDPK